MSESSQDAQDGLAAPAWAFSLGRWALDRFGARRGPLVLESPLCPLLRPSRVPPKCLKPTVLISSEEQPDKTLLVLFEVNRRALDLLRPGRKFDIESYRRFARAAVLVGATSRATDIQILAWAATGNCARQLEKALWTPHRASRTMEAA